MSNKKISSTELFILKHKTLIYFLLLVFMAVFLFISITFLTVSGVVGNTLSFANALINIIGLLLSVVLFLSCITWNPYDTRRNTMFVSLILILFVNFFFAILVYIMNGYPGLNETVFICKTISYIISAMYIFPFWAYASDGMFKRKTSYVLNGAVISCVSIFIVFAVLNYKRGFLFFVKNNFLVYNKNNLYTNIMYAFWIVFYITAILFSHRERKKKLTRLSFVVLPIIAISVNIVLAFLKIDYTMDFTAIILLMSLYLIFFNENVEQKNEFYRQQAENSELKTAIMLSQIQPHFLYNSLATISAIGATEGATKTVEVVDKFASYLRFNMDSLNSDRVVSFQKELEHIKTYLWIEQLRFGEDLKIEYNIEVSDFEIPLLTVQPLVENAVKHGICRKEEGGTVRISTSEIGGNIIITVTDDGVGFDTKSSFDDGRTHIGIANIRERLQTLNSGTLNVQSKIGKGTTATVTIFKSNFTE